MKMNVKMQRGFTLIEMIIVIVITGIIAGMVAMFIRAPVQGYVDSARRADMSDIADTALRRMARDVRTAVPNSIRLPVPAGSTYIEFLPTSDGGRYRVSQIGGSGGCGAAGDGLTFGAADSCFELIGTGIALFRGASDDQSDQIVIGSSQSDGNLPYAKTAAGRRRPYTGVTGTQTAIRITGVAFPNIAELDGHRFQVVDGTQQAVTYACVGGLGHDGNGNGIGTLRRYWAYGFNTPQVGPAALGGNNAILAENVSGCAFVYNVINPRDSLVTINLTIMRGFDSVNLYQEIHVNNIP